MRKKKTRPITRITIPESEQDKPIWKTYYQQVLLCDASCEKYHMAAAVLIPELLTNFGKLTSEMKAGLKLLEEATAAHDVYKASLKFWLR